MGTYKAHFHTPFGYKPTGTAVHFAESVCDPTDIVSDINLATVRRRQYCLSTGFARTQSDFELQFTLSIPSIYSRKLLRI
jgi:hypothetical protein